MERGNEATLVQISMDRTRPFMAKEVGKEGSRLQAVQRTLKRNWDFNVQCFLVFERFNKNSFLFGQLDMT